MKPISKIMCSALLSVGFLQTQAIAKDSLDVLGAETSKKTTIALIQKALNCDSQYHDFFQLEEPLTLQENTKLSDGSVQILDPEMSLLDDDDGDLPVYRSYRLSKPIKVFGYETSKVGFTYDGMIVGFLDEAPSVVMAAFGLEGKPDESVPEYIEAKQPLNVFKNMYGSQYQAFRYVASQPYEKEKSVIGCKVKADN